MSHYMTKSRNYLFHGKRALRDLSWLLCCCAVVCFGSESLSGAKTNVVAGKKFELRIAHDEKNDSLLQAPVRGADEIIYLEPMCALNGDGLGYAAVVSDQDGNPVISLVLTPAGEKSLLAITTNNLGKRLAVMVDGEVLSAPRLVEPLRGRMIVTGRFSIQEATQIVHSMNGVSGNWPSPHEKIPEKGFVELFNGKDLSGWIDVNTAPDTWSADDGLLVCSGQPIGVMRSEKQYENFILHIEWRHMKPGGNSGVFVWSEGIIKSGRLPKGMEVQMLELDWVNQHLRSGGRPQHIGYVSGELFGAGGLTATPDHPRGRRSMSYELRCNGVGQWNAYDVVCVDGTVKLAINGKFVNSIRESSVRKGYLCLESEGSEIHFRNIRILELPPGMLLENQTAQPLSLGK
ncbi:MAG: family 16 glycoside hydrolase [Pirellulales bacterium]